MEEIHPQEREQNHWKKEKKKLREKDKKWKMKVLVINTVAMLRRAKGLNQSICVKMRRAKRDGRNPATGA